MPANKREERRRNPQGRGARKEEKNQNKENQEDRRQEGKQTAGAHFFCLDGRSMLLSPQPLVREAGERDHVGPFVLRFPISVCIPEDHDEV